VYVTTLTDPVVGGIGEQDGGAPQRTQRDAHVQVADVCQFPAVHANVAAGATRAGTAKSLLVWFQKFTASGKRGSWSGNRACGPVSSPPPTARA
jgi:hypothetical protein